MVLCNFFRDIHIISALGSINSDSCNFGVILLWCKAQKIWEFVKIFNPGRSILSLRNTFSNFMSKHQVERENACIIYSAPEKDEQKFLSFHSHSAGSSVLQFPSNNPMFRWGRGESIAQWGEGTWIGMQTTSEVWHKHTGSPPIAWNMTVEIVRKVLQLLHEWGHCASKGTTLRCKFLLQTISFNAICKLCAIAFLAEYHSWY